LPAIDGLIGLGATALMLVLGRIAGVTGIFAGALFGGDRAQRPWRLAFIVGLLSAPLLLRAVTGEWPAAQFPTSLLMIAVGGVIVGVGVTLANGCTSGHGVCGLARLSLRSLVAVLTFMACTGVTVFLVRHVLGG
jgi:uncharacterized membrane protein YedE/YeeE